MISAVDIRTIKLSIIHVYQFVYTGKEAVYGSRRCSVEGSF